MNGLINYNIVRPELANAFAAGYEGAELARQEKRASNQLARQREQSLELGEMDLEQARADRQLMLQFQDQLRAAGKDTNLDTYFDMMISSGRPDLVEKGLMGKDKLRQQRILEQREAAKFGLEQQQARSAAERQARVNALITGQGAAPQAPVNAMSTAQAFPVEGAPVAATAPRGSAVSEIAGIYGVQPPPPVATDVTGAPVPPAEAPMPRGAEPVSEADQILGQIIALDREAAATNNPEAAAAADRLRKSYDMLTKQGMEPSQRYVPVGKNVFDRQASQFITPPTPDEVEELKPQLQKGERWNEEEGRVEAVPGSKLFIEQKQKHAKSLQTYEAVDTKSNQVFDKIDEILAEENAEAFAGNFGGYNAYATRMLPGENSDLRKKIDSLKSNMKAIGLELMRSGGSIGQMTEREWPIVEQMLGAIDPVLGEENARMEFQKIRARINQILQNAQSIYQDEWGDTQYFKPIGGASGETGKEDPLGIR